MNLKPLAFILWILCLNDPRGLSQTASQSWHKLSKPEKHWVYAHPLIARKAFRITQSVLLSAKTEEQDSKLDGRANGGQVDAFRHAYWMAMLGKTIGTSRAAKLGRAHELGNREDFEKGRTEEGSRPDSVSCAMDLQNNLEGIAICKLNPDASPEQLKTIVIREILEGKMVIIRIGADGEFLDCKNNRIDLQLWKKAWNIPKCLVPSNTP
jgi:hypothetical protein